MITLMRCKKHNEEKIIRYGITRCLSCKREGNRKSYKKNKIKINKERKENINRRYADYKYGAKKRNIVFNLSLKEFLSFVNKDCFYCNEKIKGIGIDRIESNKEYNIKNIVPCCSVCNFMKKNYSIDFFIKHCKKVSKTHSSKG